MTSKHTGPVHRIILRAAPGVTPTLDAHSTTDGSPGRRSNNQALRIDASHVVLHGLRFRNTSPDTTMGQHVVMVRLDGSNVVISDKHFDGSSRNPTRSTCFSSAMHRSSSVPQ